MVRPNLATLGALGAPCDAEADDENHFGYRPLTSAPLDVGIQAKPALEFKTIPDLSARMLFSDAESPKMRCSLA